MTTKTETTITNRHLNPKALAQISNALYDATAVYERLADDASLPERLQSQFSAQRHMAKTLAQLFEEHPAFLVENIDVADYRALIWE